MIDRRDKIKMMIDLLEDYIEQRPLKPRSQKQPQLHEKKEDSGPLSFENRTTVLFVMRNIAVQYHRSRNVKVLQPI